MVFMRNTSTDLGNFVTIMTPKIWKNDTVRAIPTAGITLSFLAMGDFDSNLEGLFVSTHRLKFEKVYMKPLYYHFCFYIKNINYIQNIFNYVVPVSKKVLIQINY